MKRIIFLFLFLFNTCSYCIVIGVLGFAPPFSFLSGDKSSYGFSIDLMDEICRRINIQCTYKAIPFAEQESKLNKGEVDLVFTFTAIPEKNTGPYIYSLPCFTSNGQFVTLTSSGINTPEDLQNKTIGVVNISSYVPIIESKKNFYKRIIKYNTIDELIAALGNKSVDAIILDFNFASYLVNSNVVVNSILIGDKIPAGNGYGMFTLPKNRDLMQKINSALINIETDGTYTALYNKYFSK